MTEKKKAGLWDRTKDVATTYTGTFIVVMILNQLLFFGFCLNPICLIAAMPHVLLITIFVGSIINKIGKWGERGLAKKAQNIVGNKLERFGDTLESASKEFKEEMKEAAQEHRLKHIEKMKKLEKRAKDAGISEEDIAKLTRDLEPTQRESDGSAVVIPVSAINRILQESSLTEEDIAKLTRDLEPTERESEGSADEGSAQEDFNQAKEHSKKGNDKEAFKWMRKAAEQGYSEAQNCLGVMCCMGQGIAKSDKEAVKWFRKAAEQGLAKAQNNLDAMYDS
jgi:TPR repeat protein